MLDSLFLPEEFYTLHPRCGTSFLVFVLIVSLLLFSFLGWPNLAARIISRLLLIPVIVQMVIMLVNDNVGAGVAVMGAFSLVRFRSAPGSAKEIVSIFLAMATGLATAKGYIALAAVFVIVISLIMIISTYVRFKEKDDLVRELKITIPEDLNYAHEFDDLFDTYTKRSKLLNVKTTNMGSLYKLSYEVELKSEDNVQSFIDDLRTRNGNLEIAVLLPAVSEGVL